MTKESNKTKTNKVGNGKTFDESVNSGTPIEGKIEKPEMEKPGEMYTEIQPKKLLTAPPFFPFFNKETGETKMFTGKYVGVYENSQLRNPLMFKEDKTNNLWLFPNNYVIKETLEKMKEQNISIYETSVEIEFIERKSLKGGNSVNVFRIYALI